MLFHIIPDAEIDARVPNYEAEFLKIRSLLVVPMRFGNEALGVLVLVNRPGADKMGMMQTASNVVSAMPTSATTSLLQSGIGFMGGR